MSENNSNSVHLSYQEIPYLYLSANEFRNTYFMLCEKITHICNKPDVIFSPNTQPLVVNGSLSVEMYLKFLYCVENATDSGVDYYKSHNNATLFDNLPENIKNIILNGCNISQDEMKSFLGTINCVEWRYEPKYNMNADVTVLSLLIDVLCNYCKIELFKNYDDSKINEDAFLSHSLTMLCETIV